MAMTAEWRARHICTDVLSSWTCHTHIVLPFVKYLEITIQQAINQARKEGYAEGLTHTGCKEAYRKGFEQALEMAAKTSEESLAPTEYAERYSKTIAARIRALQLPREGGD